MTLPESPPETSPPPEVTESPDDQPIAKASARQLTDAERAALPNQLEALLLTADRALTTEKLAEVLDVPARLVREAADELNAIYESTQRSFRIEQVAGGWQMLTLPAYAELLAALHRTRSQAKLTPAALETLAIIAYKQPVLRAQIEAIRGVASGEMIRSLMDRHLVRIAGRAEEIGRPILYGTTRTFLEVFGLGSLKDLPESDKAKG